MHSVLIDGVPYVPQSGANPGPDPSPGGPSLPPITSMPAMNEDVGESIGGGDVMEVQGPVGNIAGLGFTIVEGSRSREIKWFGSPGSFDRTSFSIFDRNTGALVFGRTNVLVSGTLGWGLGFDVLGPLPAGQYTLGVSVNTAINLGAQFVQNM